MTGSILFEAIAFLAAAIICVPIAKRLGLSSVLGYLLAGILIGPYLLGVIGEEGESIMHFAEFGVVMMLFIVGLEIEPKDFWNMRKTILGMGGAQVFGTMLITFLVVYFLGQNWVVSIVAAMAVALSSTAIALQTIKEKGLMNTTFGTSSFSILLFQDIIVIFMLAALPIICSCGEEADSMPLGLQTVAIISAMVAIVLGGRYVFVPILRVVSKTGVRELLVASALFIVFGLAFLMELVGLSPALGAFLGGVVLATSEFKHELESTLDPFKGLLLGLFFMSVGASINFIVIGDNPLLIVGLVIGVIFIKALVLFIVGTIFKLKIDQRLLLTVGLAQIGEFAFVLLSFAFSLHMLDSLQLDILLVVTALTMGIAPILGMVNERLLLPKIGTKECGDIKSDTIEKTKKVILLGFGHFGSPIGRFLRSNGVDTTIIDQDSNRVDLLRKMGFEVYYGDTTRMDLLESAGIANADILISAIGSPEATLNLVKKVKKKYPNLKMMIRAKNRHDAYDLINIGVEKIYRESIDTSIRLASDVLIHMGFKEELVKSQADTFYKYDEESLHTLAEKTGNEDEYIFKVRETIAEQEKILAIDRQKK
ncbi:UNVERIFIED_CONTAM: hypothetical protein GTU68_037650 [Idotea baltica]|nr:hypothetical protein [Idotea baltica]